MINTRGRGTPRAQKRIAGLILPDSERGRFVIKCSPFKVLVAAPGVPTAFPLLRTRLPAYLLRHIRNDTVIIPQPLGVIPLGEPGHRRPRDRGDDAAHQEEDGLVG